MSDEINQTPRPPVRQDEIQTGKNTMFNQPIPDQSDFIGPGAEDQSHIRVFLSNDTSSIDRMAALIGLWASKNLGERDLKEGRISPSVLAARVANFDKFVEENFPNKTPLEIETLCSQYYDFTDNFVEEHTRRSRLAKATNLQNASYVATDVIKSDFTPVPPGKSGKDFAVSAMMGRSSRRASQDPEMFDVLCRDSFVAMRIRRSDILERARLIQDIQNNIKGYVRRVNGNSLTVARGASYKAIFKFIADRVNNSTVKDTDDFFDLAKSILLTDMKAICCALIGSQSHKGVNLKLQCLNSGCDWHDYKMTDPAKLVKHVNDYINDEQAATLANLENYQITLSREEILKLQKSVDFKVENKLYFDNNRQFFVIKTPTLHTYFQTFDQFTSMINPMIQKIRAETPDNKEFEEKYMQTMATVAACEYMHWIDEFHVLPEPGTDGEAEVFSRAKHGDEEFNKGLLDIIRDNVELGKALIKFVHNKTPQMTNTIYGVDNFVCPGCKQNSAEAIENNKGITPIDPFMHFFIHTQLMLQDQAIALASVDTEAQ